MKIVILSFMMCLPVFGEVPVLSDNNDIERVQNNLTGEEQRFVAFLSHDLEQLITNDSIEAINFNSQMLARSLAEFIAENRTNGAEIFIIAIQKTIQKIETETKITLTEGPLK